ncbi:unnamed protein product [Protopolystoma xenopodis]|uniref:Uncharacterized protein n=1 Tax=Protopolystoma xenopodis TaxID=117903 RepID=A0A448X8M1_9PLAT|nr:unnamed protein product [Protopolystoma xenopodis]
MAAPVPVASGPCAIESSPQDTAAATVAAAAAAAAAMATAAASTGSTFRHPSGVLGQSVQPAPAHLVSQQKPFGQSWLPSSLGSASAPGPLAAQAGAGLSLGQLQILHQHLLAQHQQLLAQTQEVRQAQSQLKQSKLDTRKPRSVAIHMRDLFSYCHIIMAIHFLFFAYN